MVKKIAVINDLSGFGNCSLTVALPIISALGLECIPVPTAILSNQTGYDDFYSVDFTEHLTPFIDVWKKQNIKFDAILTGYLASEKQVALILDFIEHFGKDSLVFVDPVMADDGVLYDTYNESLCERVKLLTKKANIITPNLTELCILCGTDYNEISKEENYDKIEGLAYSLLSDTTKTVIVTGIKQKGKITNMFVQKDQIGTVNQKLLKGSFSGTGDIFSSIVCGGITKGMDVLDAISLATNFIYCSIMDTPTTLDYEPNGVNFQKHLEMLINEKKGITIQKNIYRHI
ncbi:MAG: pyridoxamine kinase [Clostridia bacterium]|nr:pyridoxamine kinase [Clostridia bacterium]